MISAASENTVLKLSSKQYFKQSEYVQISEILYQQGNWFCNLYNLNQQKWFIARCDQISYCQVTTKIGKSKKRTKSVT
ncbi:hypothetical protein [Lactobacillus acidophilus]|uniref:hypothetical protein n=1 Tax=Lactobacillus acidophilus TaxID=1579 RepID=UPI0030CA1C1C